MKFIEPGRIVKMAAILAAVGYSTTSFAATGSFEVNMAVDDAASIEVSTGSGAVVVRGADVDQVTIRARISVDERFAKRDPLKANSMVSSIKRSPPISAKNGQIVIDKLTKRTQKRHVSIKYEIFVPRDAVVKVHSESGDVRVSGVTGPVDATSDTGVVTLAFIGASPRSAFSG